MKHISLDKADKIYANCTDFIINRIDVEQSHLKSYCFTLKALCSQLGELNEDEFWKKALSPLKRYRYELCSSPLPFNCPSPTTIERIELLTEHIKNCSTLYPNHFDAYKQTVEMARALLSQSENPLLDIIKSNILQTAVGDVALLIKEPRLVEYVEQILFDIDITIVTPNQLKSDLVFDVLVITGPASWFNACEYIFYSLRAKRLHFIKFSWLSDSWNAVPIFVSSENMPLIEKYKSKRDSVTATYSYDSVLEPQEILPPQVSWDSLMSKAKKSISRMETHEERVEAYLVLLEGEKAVFIDGDESAKSLVMDFETGSPRLLSHLLQKS